MDCEDAGKRAGSLLRELRRGRDVSQRQLADSAGVNPSVVCRAERGLDARLSTWARLFDGLGYRLTFDTVELCEEAADLLAEEAQRRRDRRTEGLCTGKRRYW